MLESFGKYIDDAWDSLASVKLTIVIFAMLLLLSIPGTVVMQYNISTIDPGIQYNFDFWNFGDKLQLFTAYHSFWYVGLIVLLSLNLIACSVNRWPQMWKYANAKAVFWSPEIFARQDEKLFHQWNSKLSGEDFRKKADAYFKSKRIRSIVLKDEPRDFQLFWQAGRWSRIANYVVHTSLLIVFSGAIISSLWGFEGATNIPEGESISTFTVFKEGKHSGLRKVTGGAITERQLGHKLWARNFNVDFYKNFPGRPKSFESDLEVVDRDGKSLQRKKIVVNDPLNFLDSGVYIYQASYGRLGDFQIDLRILDKKNPSAGREYFSTNLESPFTSQQWGVELIALRATPDIQNLGPGVQFQEVKADQLIGKPFWVLQNYPQHDFLDRKSPYTIFLDNVDEKFYTGLQIGYDPGAPIYWFGAFGMIVGTMWALFITHRKYHLYYERGVVYFAGANHRIPIGFEKTVKNMAEEMKAWG